jgi:hypothetical protein
LQACYTKKDEIKEAYFKDKLEYEIEKNEISHLEWLARQKQTLIDREEGKKRRIEERKQTL